LCPLFKVKKLIKEKKKDKMNIHKFGYDIKIKICCKKDLFLKIIIKLEEKFLISLKNFKYFIEKGNSLII
jgi:hypothetical protein